MAEATERTEFKPFVPQCPFHIRKPGEYKEPEYLKLVNRVSDQVEVDKETGVVTAVMEKVDLDAEIQTYKGQCGLSYFKMLVQQGRANASDSWDDGSHAVDTTVIPESIHDAKKASSALSDAIGKAAKEIGLKDGKAYTADELLEALGAYVSSHAEKPAPSNPDAPKE